MNSKPNSIVPAKKPEDSAPLLPSPSGFPNLNVSITNERMRTRPKRDERDNMNVNFATPLLPLRPALASPEIDDLDDDRDVVSKPYPGIDDGFFSNRNGDAGPDRTDVEIISTDEPPIVITSRAGGDDDGDDKKGNGNDKKSDGDDDQGGGNDEKFDGDVSDGIDRTFYSSPGLGFDPDGNSLPDVNVYQHKKTLAQGMMDLALLSANANQLRYVLETTGKHPYYYPSLVMISLSLLLQIAVGVGLIWNATYNVKDEKEICIANRINNFTVIGIFLVTVVNVFISAFGVANTGPGNT